MHIHETHGLVGVLGDAAMITGFVFVIMLVVEYFNVLTSGRLHGKLIEQKWRQYLMAVIFGAVPGCLGGFAAASMYSHGVFSTGALIATMIATTGDESFVMLSQFPGKAFLMTGFLMVLGILVGAIVDVVVSRRSSLKIACDQKFEVHEDKESCDCFNVGQIIRQWKQCIPARGILAVALGIFTVVVVLGYWEADEWDWVRVTLLVLGAAALFIVSTVPDHFLEEHLWHHVARKHIPRIFAWTLGALLVMYFVTGPLEKDSLHNNISGHDARWVALVLACLVGLIPQSGPHLIFVFAYAHGAVPFGVLLASSIVQDGHGMLPILADSRRVFAGVKVLKFFLGLSIGAAALLLDL